MHGTLKHTRGGLRALALLAALLSACRLGAFAQDDGLTPFFEGRVTRVVDGNTLVVQNQTTGQPVRVRLRGTDAPELRQAWGAESRRRLEAHVGAQVRVEFKLADKYGQVLGLVLKDGEDLNLSQLSEGLAWFHTQFANELTAEDRKLYEAAEREARAARRGLWKDKTPVAPWEYRRAHNVSEDPRDEPQQPAVAVPAVNANRRTKTYFTPDCAGFARVPARTRVRFKSAAAAEQAGYKRAPDCESK